VNASVAHDHIAEEDVLRADLYNFLGSLLARPPQKDVISKTASLSGDETDLGKGIIALSRVASAANEKSAEREYNALFVGMGRGELLPFASFYMTGFLNEKPLAQLREDMKNLGIVRAANVFEPEDNIASLCEMMAGLIMGRFGEPADLSKQAEFHNRHIGPWAEHFFTDLEAAKSAVFYAPVGAIGRVFMEIEREAFRLAGETTA